MTFAWRKWKLGLVMAIVLALIVAGAGLNASMNFRAFIQVFCAALLTHLLAFLKDHPVDSVEFSDGQPKNDSMKKTLSILLFAALAIGALGVLPGCATKQFSVVGPNGATNIVTKSVPDVAQMCTVAKSASYLGLEVWIRGIPPTLPAHPQDLQKCITVRNSLKALIAAGTFSAGDLTSALQSLPINELKGDQGSLIVGEAVILWDQYGQQLASLDKAQVFDTYLLPVAQAILDGLNMALGPGQ